MACLKKLSYLETIMAIYKGTDGNDTITASEQRDTLEGYGGDDILMGLAGSDRLFGGTGNDWLSGGGSSDSLYGELGDDTLEGGEGSDHLYGGEGADSYVFAKGAGYDTIQSGSADASADTVKFIDVASTDVLRASRDNYQDHYGDFYLLYGNGDLLTIEGYFNAPENRVGQIQFSDSVVWTWDDIQYQVLKGTAYNDDLHGFDGEQHTLSGLDGDDIIYGANLADTLSGDAGSDYLSGEGGDDVLSGGLGNDGLKGGDGADIFLFAKGDGYDTIQIEYYYENNHDIVKFTNVASTELAGVKQGSYGELLLSYGDGDHLHIDKYFYGSAYRIGEIHFSDGVVWTWENIYLQALHATEGDDYLTGLENSENTLAGLAGNDKLTGGSLADHLDGGSGYDTLYGNAGDDSLSGGLSGDVLWGGDGDDTLSGDGGNDVLYGERGNDILSGGNGKDTYLFSIGAGQDLINNYHADNKADTIRFDNVGLADVTAINRSGDDLIIHYGTDDQLTVSGQFGGGDYQVDRFSFMNYFNGPGPRHIVVDNIIVGGDGDDNLVGTDANDLLVGQAGADSLTGGEGNDVYFVDNSADSVTEAELQGSDTVVSSVTYTLTGFTEKLTLLSGAADATGNALNNVLLGNAGANTLAGAEGNDTLIGGEGADTLIGGLGKDTLLLNESASATDTVKIGVTDSLLGAFDTIQGFRLGEDKLDLYGSLIAADANSVDGVNVGHIQSHAIKNGIISFDNTDSFHHALSPYFTSVASMLEYLQLNLNNGETVAFEAPNYSSYVFQDHGAEDTVVQLTGVLASRLVTDGTAEYGIWLS
ncbi:hypothetical protein CEK71_05960 [Methylovulum psychrotolerans]|uniref:Haemolysin-type calcium binding-related domain-containing protein n=2 Tax=Methylovulum psychrotolerans TaxID=1704499 RepID=A0A1Z4BWN4_9GAMM|nr:hypothetical protein CEK71_05960 [Methylovulum psychrotolerans]